MSIKRSFKNVIAETEALPPNEVERLIICSGRVYYDLIEKRQQINAANIAIVRVEQLYPFPDQELAEAIAPYKNVKKVLWCQEEPKNQGAWYSTQHHLREVISRHNDKLYLEFAGREASAAPAAGYMALHLKQLEEFINQAITG